MILHMHLWLFARKVYIIVYLFKFCHLNSVNPPSTKYLVRRKSQKIWKCCRRSVDDLCPRNRSLHSCRWSIPPSTSKSMTTNSSMRNDGEHVFCIFVEEQYGIIFEPRMFIQKTKTKKTRFFAAFDTHGFRWLTVNAKVTVQCQLISKMLCMRAGACVLVCHACVVKNSLLTFLL